jgi:hypothetical protein
MGAYLLEEFEGASWGLGLGVVTGWRDENCEFLPVAVKDEVASMKSSTTEDT